MISAKIIADSTGKFGHRITTFVLEYPRFVHSEFMTHRAISKNSASSRAIPSAKMVKDIQDNPAVPVFWGKNQSGMQAAEELAGVDLTCAKDVWLKARNEAIIFNQWMQDVGLHKQIANRILEPWFHMRVVATATDWANFFALRSHEMAQPEIAALSDAMLYQYVNAPAPKFCHDGQWHLPFVSDEEADDLKEQARLVSAARCARVSYLNHDGTPSPFDKDVELFNRLTTARPGHWSPLEHPSECDQNSRHGNFTGWKQYRKFFHQENIQMWPKDLKALLEARAAAGSIYAKAPVE